MKNIAIILAGGIGSRVGGEMPKQLLPLQDGRSILEHAVDAFEQAFCIDEIAIVMHSHWLNEAEDIIAKNDWKKVTKLIPGGAERWKSSYNAVMAYKDLYESDKAGEYCLWFHDCARPFVSQRILASVAEALEEHPAVTVAVPVTDTLYRVKENAVISTPQRSDYMRAQTPQAFRLANIYWAFKRVQEESWSGQDPATDDVGILRRYQPDVPVYIVPGDESNKKITYKEDL